MSPDAFAGLEAPGANDPNGHEFEALAVGMTARYAKTLTNDDVVLFSGLSGDINPLHLDHDFASRTMFGGTIVHGMLTASLISTVIGTRLPGPGCVYMSQSLFFRAPVRVGAMVEARATIVELVPGKRRARLETVCAVDDVVVLDGEALVMVPARTG